MNGSCVTLPRAPRQATYASGTAMQPCRDGRAGPWVARQLWLGAVGMVYTRLTPSETKQPKPGTTNIRQQGPSYTTHLPMAESHFNSGLAHSASETGVVHSHERKQKTERYYILGALYVCIDYAFLFFFVFLYNYIYI